MSSAGGYLDRNLSYLRELGQTDLADRLSGLAVSGDVVVSEARSGDLTLSVGLRHCHSQYDPRREASGLVGKLLDGLDSDRPLVVIGVGLGYLAEMIPESWKNTTVVLYEPEVQVAAAGFSAKDFKGIIGQYRYVAGPEREAAADLRELLGESARDVQIVILPAWRELYGDVIGRLKSALNGSDTNEVQDGRLSILLVGPVYGGSLPVTGYVHDAFKRLGHDVEWFDVSPLKESLDFFANLKAAPDHLAGIHAQYTHLMSQSVLARAMELKPQIAFFMAQAPATPELLNELRGMGIATAMWFVEDGRRFAYGEKMAPYYDFFFHIQRGEFEASLKAAGARNVHYLPMAADPEVHKPLDLSEADLEKYGSELSHVGAGYPNRRQAFQRLINHDFKLWGSEWDGAEALKPVLQEDGRRINTDEIVKIYNATKININLHSSMDWTEVDNDGDFVNPRTLEIAACGGFQLVDKRSLLPEMFEEGREVVTFDSIADLIDKIDYYLEHPGEADQIAQAGRARVLREHTYETRMREALSIIRNGSRLPEKTTSENRLADWIDGVKDDRELEEFLRGFGDLGQELSLPEIGERVRNGEGEMSRPEAILLLMDEFNRWAVEKGMA